MEFGHDTIMGILLAAAGAVTIAYLTAASRAPALRVLALVGAAATIVIGLLLFFGLA